MRSALKAFSIAAKSLMGLDKGGVFEGFPSWNRRVSTRFV